MSEWQESANTDRNLWRETEDDYFSPRLFVTASGKIGMDVGGFVIVMPIRDWHNLALPLPSPPSPRG